MDALSFWEDAGRIVHKRLRRLSTDAENNRKRILALKAVTVAFFKKVEKGKAKIGQIIECFPTQHALPFALTYSVPYNHRSDTKQGSKNAVFGICSDGQVMKTPFLRPFHANRS